MNQNIKISVIIPVYNAEKYVEKALLSVINQEYVDEILVVNDNSKDQSVEIINKIQKRYPDKISILSHNNQTNVGAGKARNIGIKAAKNEWLAFLDVDDYYYPNRFENAISTINKNKDADGVYEAVENVFLNEEVKTKFITSRPKRYSGKDLKKRQFFFTLDKEVIPEKLFGELMRGDIGFFHFNGVLIKKDLFEKVGHLNEDLKLTQDTDVFFKMAMIGKLYAGKLSEPVAARMIHESNRIYNDNGKLKYYSTLKYFGFREWSKDKNLNTEKMNAIHLKNAKICANLLGVNIYKQFRMKYFFLKLFYPLILPIFLKIKKSKLNIS